MSHSQQQNFSVLGLRSKSVFCHANSWSVCISHYITAPFKRKHLAVRLILNKILSAWSKIVETVNENISDFYTLKMDAFERRRDIKSELHMISCS